MIVVDDTVGYCQLGKLAVNRPAVCVSPVPGKVAVGYNDVGIIMAVDPTAVEDASTAAGVVIGDEAVVERDIATVQVHTDTITAFDEAVFEAAGIGGMSVHIYAVPGGTGALDELNAVLFGSHGGEHAVNIETEVSVEVEHRSRGEREGAALHHSDGADDIIASGAESAAQSPHQVLLAEGRAAD